MVTPQSQAWTRSENHVLCFSPHTDLRQCRGARAELDNLPAGTFSLASEDGQKQPRGSHADGSANALLERIVVQPSRF